ncbi:MAG TPA: hypothetical protein VNA16_02575 [Abditibacteriaceae bacterium]|nr:hypothetical protein [Abditibacteriaceae bacterium]
MPEEQMGQTPFDELVEVEDAPGDAPPRTQSTATPRRRSWNALKFLNAVRWPSPARLPTGTLVGLSMTAGALLILILSSLLHYILPRPQSRFNVSAPVAVKPRPAPPALVEIEPRSKPSTVATAPAVVDVMHRAPSAVPVEADVIKDPQAFEFEQKLREQRRQENEKIVEARKLEDEKILEQRKLDDQKLLEQQRLDEDQRLAAERKLEDEKLAEARKLEDERIAEARQRAEQRKLEADQKLAEQRKAEDERHTEQRKLEDEKLLEQRQLDDQQRQGTSKL